MTMLQITTQSDYMHDALNIDFQTMTINKIKCNFTMQTQNKQHIAFFAYIYAYANGYRLLNVIKSDVSAEMYQQCISFKQLTQNDLNFWSRALGTVISGAMGDALGYCVEFLTEAQIQHRYGVFTKYMENCSDDTQMTVFSLLSLLHDKNYYFAYKEWFKTQQGERNVFSQLSPALQHRRSPGNTCMSSLSILAQSVKDVPARNNSKGCGTIMRVAPFGIYAASRDEAFRDAFVASKVTHGHIDAALSAAVFAALVFDLVRGGDLMACVANVDSLVPAEHASAYAKSDTARLLGSLRKQLENAAERPKFDAQYFRSPFLDALHALGEGWVADEALVIGILAYARSWDLHSALVLAANHDGDSDSTAILAGNLYGAQNGLKGVALEGICCSDLAEELMHMTYQLYTRREEQPDQARAPQQTDELNAGQNTQNSAISQKNE